MVSARSLERRLDRLAPKKRRPNSHLIWVEARETEDEALARYCGNGRVVTDDDRVIYVIGVSPEA